MSLPPGAPVVATVGIVTGVSPVTGSWQDPDPGPPGEPDLSFPYSNSSAKTIRSLTENNMDDGFKIRLT